jgi:hypothetical protein
VGLQLVGWLVGLIKTKQKNKARRVKFAGVVEKLKINKLKPANWKKIQNKKRANKQKVK